MKNIFSFLCFFVANELRTLDESRELETFEEGLEHCLLYDS